MNDIQNPRKLKQAELHLWFDDQAPRVDYPAEIVGVMVGEGGQGVDLERSQQFASDVLRIHWSGECDCQSSQRIGERVTQPEGPVTHDSEGGER